MTVLSYGSFPHIIEAILGYAGGRELFAARLVCRGWRTIADSILCHHLIVTQTDPGTVVVAHTPIMREYGGNWTHVAPIKVIHPLSWSQLPAHPKLQLTAKTRVLDIAGYCSSECNLNLLHSVFPRLEMLRMQTCTEGGYTPYIPIKSDTFVLFTNRNGEACVPPGCIVNYTLHDSGTRTRISCRPALCARYPPDAQNSCSTCRATT